MNWAAYSFIVGSSYRRKVVLSLDVARTPSQIARKTSISTSHVSRVLKELEKKGVAKCMVPKRTAGRVYALTEEGKKQLHHLKKAEQGIEGKDAKR